MKEASMGQQSPVYAFVARGTVVLAEYLDFMNFPVTAAPMCLELPASSNMFIYNSYGFTFYYIVEDGLIYCVVSVELVGQRMPTSFLVVMKDDFSKRYGAGKATSASCLNREFGPKLKEHMQYCVDNPEDIVKTVMMKHLEKDPYCGEEIELLIAEAKNLASKAEIFMKPRTQVRGMMWLENMFRGFKFW